MKILVGYSYYSYEMDIRAYNETWLARLRAAGLDVQGTCLTLDPPGPCLTWPELDARWRRRDRELLTMYENLARLAEGYDVFVNANGINLHPEFVPQLPTFNAFACFDDPENSDNLSKPVAAAYDLSLVGNIACLDAYRSWGVKEARFWPNGFRVADYDPSLTKDKILSGRRDVDVTMLCERQSHWRKQRLDRFTAVFPDGAYYGPGWPKGFLPESARVPLLQRTRVGINMHNSTGPINFRTFYLPANGVLQVCDNKSHLAKIFELGREVAGYDTIEEAIELCRHYLAHEDERRQVAAAGWERALRDYNEVAVFKLVERYVNEVKTSRAAASRAPIARASVNGHASQDPPADACPDRSAGFQPAVSPTSSRPSDREVKASAGWKPATQQTGGLRYDRGKPTIFLHTDLLYEPDKWYQRFEFVLKNQTEVNYRLVNLLEKDITQLFLEVRTGDALIGRFGHHPDDLKRIRPIYGQLARVFEGRIFPRLNSYHYYDDKLKQWELFQSKGYPAPATAYVTTVAEVEGFVAKNGLRFPLVTKQLHGAGSSTVKLAADARLVAVPCLIQEFCAGNDRDWRLNVIGDRVMGFERLNRDNDFRASGSGKIVYPSEFDPELVQLAHRISKENNFDSMAYDFVKRNGQWVVLEISYAYQDFAVRNCEFYYDMNSGGVKRDKRGVYPQDFILEDFLREHYGIDMAKPANESALPSFVVSPVSASSRPRACRGASGGIHHAPPEGGATSAAVPATVSRVKPRILLIADVPNWIFERHAHTLQRLLSDEFDCVIGFRGQPFREDDFDLIYPLEWDLVQPEQVRNPARYVTGVRSHCSWDKEHFADFVQRLRTGFQRVHVVSQRLHRILAPHVPDLICISHGIVADLFQPSTRADRSGQGRLRLGWAGNRKSPNKGFAGLIEPLGRLPGVDLVFCGYSDRNLTLEEMRGFYDSIDAYICASDLEGNNNSLMESAAMARAIVTTENGTVPEYLRDGESALIVSRQLPEFIRAVERLRDDPSLRVCLGEKARAAALAKWDWKDRSEDYRAFFRASLAASGYAPSQQIASSPQQELITTGATAGDTMQNESSPDSPVRSTKPLRPARINIAILTHNALDYTRLCIDSLAKHTPVPFNIFVLDNASTDATPSWLAAHPDPNLHYELSPKNLGVPGGRNRLIQRILPNTSDDGFIVFFDNDLEVQGGWHSHFLELFDAHPEVGIAGKIGHDIIIHGDSRELLHHPEAAPAPADVASGGFACWIRAEVLRKIGAFDENLGLFWHEDDDICVRAMAAGYETWAVPTVPILHHGHKSGVGVSGLSCGGSLENQRYLIHKWRQHGWVDDRGRIIHRPDRALVARGVEIRSRRRPATGGPVIGIDARALYYVGTDGHEGGQYTASQAWHVASLRPNWRFVLYLDANRLAPALERLTTLPNVRLRLFDDYEPGEVALFHMADPMNLSAGFDSPTRLCPDCKSTAVFFDFAPAKAEWNHWVEPKRQAYLHRLDQLYRRDTQVLATNDLVRTNLTQSTRLGPDRVQVIHAPRPEEIARKTISIWQQMLGVAEESAPMVTAPAPMPEPVAPVTELPVRWCGPIFNPSGYASEAINFILPLSKRANLGIFHHNNLYSEKFVAGLPAHEREALFALRDKFATITDGIVISHNPANGFLRVPGAAYHIGRTMFEAEGIPREWVTQCNQMDEVWVPSQFNIETFSASGVERDKLVVMPEAVDTEEFDPARHTPLPLPNRAKFNFLSIFEWSSRKGWDVLLAAYLREFSAEDDVCLYLRTYLFSKPDGDPGEAIRRLIREYVETLDLGSEPRPRIEVLAEQVPLADLPRLYKAADCLVIPSRGEGWGRPHHEAMLMELPVIATNWSGNTEFMNADNSYPIDFELNEARGLEAELWHYRGHRWANPSEKHLRELMRHVQQHPTEAREKGSRARLHMVKNYSRERVVDRVVNRLAEIERKISIAACPAVVARALEVKPEFTGQKPQTIHVAWEGSFVDYGSLSQVNRELTRALETKPRLQLTRVGKNTLPPELADVASLQSVARRLKAQSPKQTQVTVRHAWPPSWEKPAAGAWVLIQPWEYGVLPEEWVKQLTPVDEVWVPSEYCRRVYVESGVDPSKVKVVPNGVDPERFRSDVAPMKLATRKSFKFLFVGGTIHRKGPDLLLAVYLEHFTAADDVCLVIKDFGAKSAYAGQTLEAKIREALQQPNAPEILYLTDELPPEQLPALYTACDCLVHPYRGEGFGLPVIEAMACGLPVIVTAGGATDDFATDEHAYRIPARRAQIGEHVGGMKLAHTGWLLEPVAISLGVRMQWVVANREEARAKGRAASEYARREWSWDRAAQIAAQRLQNLVARKQADASELSKRRSRKAVPIELPAVARVGHLGDARQSLERGQFFTAWNTVVSALQVRPFHPEAYALLAQIAENAGDVLKAKYCFERARQLAPGLKLSRLASPQGPITQSDWPSLPPAAASSRLSVCLITRNEEQFLGRCLASVRPIAHQIVVLDTGSTDRTAEIAKQHGAEVHSFQWCDDFSAARNAALEHVTGDWVLVLDADEELPASSHPQLLIEMEDAAAMAYRLPIVDAGKEEEGHNYVPRLFRNGPGLFYVGRVHEQVFSSIEVRRREWGLENRLSKATILHHGYAEEVVRQRGKNSRNLRLLERAIEEFPNEPNLLMNFGLELARAGRLQDGIEQYVEAFHILSAQPKNEVVPELRETLLTQLCSHLMGTKDFDGIVSVLRSPLARSAGLTASMHFALGLANMELKQFVEAVEEFKQCLAKRDQPSLSPVNKDIRRAAPHHCLSGCYMRLNQPDAAEQNFRAALAEDARSRPVRLDYARFRFEQGKPVEALQLLTELVSEKADEVLVWQVGGQIALSKPEMLEFACDWTGEAVKHVSDDRAILLQRAQALLLSGRADEALPFWQKAHTPTNGTHLAALLLCQVATGGPLAQLPQGSETIVSGEFVKWYRRLLDQGTGPMVGSVNEALERVRAVLPTAVGVLEAALAEAKQSSVA